MIRSALPGDRQFIHELSRAVFSEYTPRAGARTTEMTDAEHALTFVAESRGVAVGFAVLVAARPTAHLDAIAVTERARGRGVGRELLARIEAEARARGAAGLGLYTADCNLAALDLFFRSGFSIVERRPRFYARGQAAVRMEKAL